MTKKKENRKNVKQSQRSVVKVVKKEPQKRKNSKDVPFFSKVSKTSPPSLENMGATCYLNSAFQGISACNTFVKEMNVLYESYKDCRLVKLELFKDLIDVLNNCSRHKMNISTNDIFNNWNKKGEQDSFEVLSYSLNQVYNEVRKHNEDTGVFSKKDLKSWLMVKLPMRFTMQYSITCACSKVVLSPLQSDLAIHVSIHKKNKYKLNELIEKHFEMESIEDYVCDEKMCCETSAKRLVRLCKPLPLTFCIHLQRTFWDGKNMNKINRMVEFSMKVIIKSKFWTKDGINIQTVTGDNDSVVINNVRNEGKDVMSKVITMVNQHCNVTEGNTNDPILKNKFVSNCENDNDDQGYVIEDTKTMKMNETTTNLEDYGLLKSIEEDEEYGLVSVIEHSGVVSCGHYICYKKVGNRWFKTDDCLISEVSEETVLKCQAYILFYEQFLEIKTELKK